MSVTTNRLRIGTRRSSLARWQAEHVADRIRALPGAPSVDIVFIKTEGDRITDVPLHAVEGKAFFTKEIEQALLREEVDLAVHSLKDLATQMPNGLEVGAVLEREDPRDVLLSRSQLDFEQLPKGARVGTSSLRRRALLARWRSDLNLLDLRGNVPTRIDKLLRGEFDAIVLAAAGVKRLGLDAHVTEYLSTDRILPAVSQGAVAIQVRNGDDRSLPWIKPLDHPGTNSATTAERTLLHQLGGGCQVPVGALATVAGDLLRLSAVVCSLDGAHSIERLREGHVDVADEIGLELAGHLLRAGAGEILAGIRVGRAGR